MRFGSTHFEQFTTLALRASLAAAIAVLAMPSIAQTPSIPGTGSQSLPPGVAQQLQSNPKYRQWQYFYRQRAFPYDRIAPGALQAARQDFIAKWGTAPGASVRQSTQAPGSPAVNQWSSIGPTPIANAGPASGRLNTIAVNPSNTSVIYIGAADGGVWKTSDGGSTWTPLTDGQCSLAMGALAIDPVNTNIVYAGTGEQNFSLDSYYGCGVLRSANGGQTWTQLGASSFVTSSGGATISRILIDPVTAGSTTATTIVLTANFGVYRSTDSGSTWSNVLPGVATDAVRDPSTSSTIYAALGDIFGSGSNGIYKSTNGGQTWTQLGGGFPTSNVGRINLAIAPSASSTLYAVVQNSGTFGLLGVWKSTNGGTNWTQVSATNLTCTFGGSAQCWYDLYVYVDPNNANTLYIGTQEVYKSIDGGSTFTDIGGYSGNFHPDQHALAFAPNSSSVIYVGNDGGIWKTSDGGSTWSPLNQNLTITQFGYGLSTTPDGTKVLGGTQDNGTNLYTGSNAWNEVWGGDGGFTAIDFNTPTTFYTENFQVSPQRSTDGGASWSGISTGILAGHSLFYTPFVMSPTNSQTLYIGTDYLNKTTNQGSSWSQIGSPGVAGFNPTGENVSAIAEAKSNAQVVYVGMDGGRVQVTANGGTSWSDITAGLPTRYISHISVNPTNEANAFVSVSGFGSGHVFETATSGASWTDISGNLPDIPVNTILFNPSARNTDLFVGTDLGVFHTADGGSTWSPYQNGLPDVVVYDLVYNNTTGAIFAATHGRGVWKVVPGNSTSAAHDFNGDGKSDILWRNSSSGAVVGWLMNGGAVLSGGTIGGAPTNWQIIAQRDFNGDGKADILWRDNTTGTVRLWIMNGLTVTQDLLVASNVPSHFVIAGVGDFNGDGNADILWRDSNTGYVSMWFMNGATATGANVGSVPLTYSIIGASPNGHILWRNNGTGALTEWVMNGAAVSQTHNLGTVNPPWAVVGSGDFDGNGSRDLLLRNGSTGQVLIWFYTNGVFTSSANLGNISTAYSVDLIGDFDGNGKSDIVWTQTSGARSIWFMNGGAVASTASLGTVATTLQIQSKNAE